MNWWMWCVSGLVLLLAELITPGGFYLMFFGLGAIATGLLVGMYPAAPGWLQWIVFPIVSVLMIVGFRDRMLARFRHDTKADVDSMVGERASALEPISAGSSGLVQMRGTTWRARNAGLAPIESGSECEVEKVEGIVLVVKGRS